MQYQKMRERQLSEEQEKRLEEEIMRKLSSINMVLNKAKEKIQIMSHDEQHEEVKGLTKIKDDSSDAKLDLHRVFVDDNDNKIKSQAISKWKDIKKDGRAKLKELEKQEEALRMRVERRAKKFGVMAKNARIKGPDIKGTEIEELNQVCQAVVQREGARQEQEKIVQSEMTKMYLKELKSGQGHEAKLFYDYYALWVINKRVNELAASSSQPIHTQMQTHQALFKNTFIVGQTLFPSEELQPDQQTIINPHRLISMAENHLFEMYKQGLKSMKQVFSESVDDGMTQVLSYKPLILTQKQTRQLIDNLDQYNEAEHNKQVLSKASSQLGEAYHSDPMKMLGMIKEIVKVAGYRGKPKTEGLRQGKTTIKRCLVVYQE